MSILQRAAIAGFLCLIIAVPFGRAWGADRRILGVQVSPDLKHITIKCDSPLGKHSSFVIQRPCRLVLDLEATALGSVPSRIAVGRDPINEIRLGYLNERARVAIDFGDHVVPPFKIEQVHNNIVVTMGAGPASPRREAAHSSAPDSQRKPVAPRMPAVQRPHPTPDAVGISVKNAGVANNMVYVELTNRKNPKQPYRLVIDMDPEAMLPKQATLSDAGGNLKRFEMTSAAEPSPESAAEPTKTAIGPRKAPVASESQEGDKKKFKWGVQPAAQSSGELDRPSSRTPPFHIEEFQLEERKNMATSN